MHQVSSQEIKKIRRIVERCVGSLMLIQEGEFNPAEKLKIFVTSARVLGRTILWGTTITSHHLSWFIARCSLGYNLYLDDALDILIHYGCSILDEIVFYENRLKQEALIGVSIEDDDEDLFEA